METGCDNSCLAVRIIQVHVAKNLEGGSVWLRICGAITGWTHWWDIELLVEGVVAVIEVPKSEELVLELMEVENMVLGVGVITEPHGPEELEDPLLDPKMLVGLVVVLAARMKLGRLDGIVKVVLDEMALPEDIMLLKELSTVLMVGIVYCEDVLFEEVSVREVLVAVLVPELRVN